MCQAISSRLATYRPSDLRLCVPSSRALRPIGAVFVLHTALPGYGEYAARDVARA